MELLHVKWNLVKPKGDFSEWLDNVMLDDNCEKLLDLGNKHYTLLDNTGEYTRLIKPVQIQFFGISEFWNEYCLDIGEELIVGEVKEFIIDYINKQINFDFDLSKLLRIGPRDWPNNGEFILVFDVNTFIDYNPCSSTEYDMNINCLGVLEEHVKLVKEK